MELYNAAKIEGSPLLSNPSWPIVLAQHASAALANPTFGREKATSFPAAPIDTPAQPIDALRKQFLEYKAKAEQGDPVAQFELGNCYGNGRGVKMDFVEAVKWYRKAADQGHAGAQLNLGGCYCFGTGVEKNTAEGVKWYRKAADQNDAKAQRKMADCYQFGLDGVEQDFKEAVTWYRKAAEQDDATAQVRLGLNYERGQGLEKDFAEAVKWYRKAAEKGDTKAQVRLGVCYFLARGVEKDFTEAYAWLNLASTTEKQGVETRDKLEPVMSPQQVADAQKRTKELRAIVEASAKAKAAK